MDVLRQENWTYHVTEKLKDFEKSLIIALKEKGWDGSEDTETVNNFLRSGAPSMTRVFLSVRPTVRPSVRPTVRPSVRGRTMHLVQKLLEIT